MITEIELLNSIHENADMGQDSLSHILTLSTDSAFTKVIEKQRREYAGAMKKSEAMLQKRQSGEPKEIGAMTKVMSGVMTRIKTLADPSTSKLAEMVFQGNNMGVSELTRQLNAYSGKDQEVLDFARKQLKQEEEHAEAVKKFL